MKRCLRITGSLAFGLALGLSSAALAEEEEVCSPGFYKNHTELWYNVSSPSCCTELSCDTLLSYLHARGPGSNVLRDTAADTLNACFQSQTGGLPCETGGDTTGGDTTGGDTTGGDTTGGDTTGGDTTGGDTTGGDTTGGDTTGGDTSGGDTTGADL